MEDHGIPSGPARSGQARGAAAPAAPGREQVRGITRRTGVALVVGCLIGGMAMVPVVAPAAASDSDTDGWVLSTTDTVTDYAPAFVGNGYFSARVPAAGAGYEDTELIRKPGQDRLHRVPSQAELAGFFAEKSGKNLEPRASLPTWTTLGFGRDDGNGGVYGLQRPAASAVSNYRQSLDLRTGVLTSMFDWTSPAGDRTGFTYEVNTNRANAHLGTVTVKAVPQWSGTATVVDAFDHRGLSYSSANGVQVDGASATLTENVVSNGSLVTAALNSVLRIDGSTVPTTTPTVALPDTGSAAQQTTFPVTAGESYEITKFVGVASSVDTDRSLTDTTPQQAAADAASTGAAAGYRQLLDLNNQAWSELWQSSISVPGDPVMTAKIHASMFYLLASQRSDVNWSTGPSGLSSDGQDNSYNGHVFWDMETWMYPSLLAQYPDIANTANTYRQRFLNQAEEEAARRSTPTRPIKGAKFPWESALTGKEVTHLDWPTFPEKQLHINSMIALAHWQYYQASGDTAWLRDKAWPVLKDIADFWATRAERGEAGGYDIRDVVPADEFRDKGVDNSVSTNAGAQASLRFAVQAADILGLPADPAWSSVADGLKFPMHRDKKVHLEYEGYDESRVKQADTTLMQYPLGVQMSRDQAQRDLDYYTAPLDDGQPRTDQNGPSMTDAIFTINAAALGTPGCMAYNHLVKSIDPILAAPFHQFHESRRGEAFNFNTGAGGYLQQFLYGFTGLRWGTDAVTIDPFLPSALPGDDVTGIKWHGTTFDVSVGQQNTTVTVQSGPGLAVKDGSGSVHQVAAGTTLQLPTRHPAPTTGPTHCDGHPSGPITGAASDRCVNAPDADGTPVRLNDCTGTDPAQTWTLPGDTTLRALGKCLDVQGGSGADGTPVQLYACNGSPAQQWTYEPGSKSLKSLGKCLDATDAATAAGTRLQLWTCQGGTSQQWDIPTLG